jgi:hypothetical protein
MVSVVDPREGCKETYGDGPEGGIDLAHTTCMRAEAPVYIEP